MYLEGGHQKIYEKIDELDTSLQKLFNELAKYDQSVLNHSKSPGVWSVMQVLSHVMLSERLSLAYVKKKLSFNPPLRRAGFRSRLRLYLLQIYSNSSLKFKAPKGLGSQDMPVFSGLPELRDSWNLERKELVQYLLSLDRDLLDREIYKHPFVGRLTLVQMVLFFELHFKRHERQIYHRLP